MYSLEMSSLGFKSNINLETVLTKDRVRNLFSKSYLPDITIMEDGTIFINTIKKSMINSNTNVSKFVFINREGEFVDSTSLYTPIPMDGYMIRLDILEPYLPASISIAYIVDIQSLDAVTSYNQISETEIEVIYEFTNDQNIPETILRNIHNTIYNDPTKTFSDMIKDHIN